LNKISTHQAKQFSARILSWFEKYGRHHLPWQKNATAYSIWLSEIMLQQTQVITVIDYYQRFLTSFPTLQSLASAPIDDVLALWAGLGYYARARNLHKTAGIICNEYNGQFPDSLEAMQSLPGIGKSTAAAILTFAMKQSHAILDGNVKRVIARYYEIEGWSGRSSTLKELWLISEALTPQNNTAQYNQAMMDMGATMCTRSKPKCFDCCLNESCLAYKNKSWQQYPNPKPKKAKPTKLAYLVLLKHNHTVYLEKRAPSGIWGGLWSLPEFETEELAKQWLQTHCKINNQEVIKTFSNELLHRFSHYNFMIHLIHFEANELTLCINDQQNQFLSQQQVSEVGLPTPIKSLLAKHF